MASNTKLTRAIQLALVAAAVYGTAAVAQEGEIEQIVVTGSRISRPDLQEASPIQSIGTEEIALQGTANVENILNTLPQVVGATTQTSNNPGGGVATVNLRNLGTQRTLVLVDGRRYISYDTDQVVDLNTIPTALIERIDVVTGGRSAVYGSDAMAGVVNFIMKKNFEGVELSTGYEISDKGDGARQNVSATMGGNFADGKGNAVLFGDWTRRDAVYADARSFTKHALQDNQDGTAFFGGSSSIPGFRARIPGLNAALGYGGTDVKFDSTGQSSRYVSTDAWNFAPSNFLQVPQERYTVAGIAHYDINDHFKPYMEAQFVNNRVDNELAPTPIGSGTPRAGATIGAMPIHVYSPYFDAATRNALIALDTDGDGYVNTTNWGKRLEEVGNRQSLFDRNAYRVVGGMEGNIWGDWNYDTYFMKARTTNSVVQNGNVSISKFVAGIKTAFLNPNTGAIQAQPWNIVGLDNGGAGTLVCAPGSPAGCVPINAFGPGRISADAVNYMKIGTINSEFAETQVVSASVVNSNLYDWGAGPIGLAFGWENRQEKGAFQPDQFLSSGDVAGFNPGLPTKGQYSVSDLFLELNVPIVSGVTGINKLEFNGAIRNSDYSNSVGNVTTYAAGLVYEPVKGFGLRAQYQRAIRGPSISELYLGNTVSFDGAVDPCTDNEDNPPAPGSDLYNACIATGVPAEQIGHPFGTGSSFAATQGGYSGLKEETSDTYTIGLVIQPTFFDNFVATIDYYNIKIDDVIQPVGAQNIVDACYQYGVAAYCDRIDRDESGQFALFDDKNQNAASLETEGVDLQMTYNIDLLGNSNLAFSLLGTYVIKNDYTPIVILPIVNECAGAFGRNCGDPDPEWRHNFRTTWTTGPFTASAMWRHLGSATDDDKTVTYYREKFDAIDYFDLAFGYEFGDHVSANLGIDNVADKEPQLGASTQQLGNVQQSNTYPATYDVLGRYWWMTLRLKF
jgi:outer membrane receptor protein involved in Fe transport